MASGGETGEPRNTPHLTTFDPERILRLLNQARVEYMLIGGRLVSRRAIAQVGSATCQSRGVGTAET